MAATLVWTVDEEAALAVAKFVAEMAWAEAGEEISAKQVSQFCLEAEQFLTDGKNRELVRLLTTSSDIVLANASEKDVECVFAVISNFVKKEEEGGKGEEAEAMANEIAEKLTARPAEKPALRLKLLICLYNLIPSSKARYSLFMRALNFSVQGKVTELMVPCFKRLDTFIREWGIGTREQRTLFLAVTNILKDTKGSSRESFLYLVKYLGTFTGEDPSTLIGAREEALRAALEFMKAPDLFQSDLLEMPPVLQLEKDSSYALATTLLRIFLTGHVDDYLKFYAQNNNFVSSFGLIHEDNLNKMRLLSLAALASESEDGTIKYSQVQETLQVSHDDVELWVVKAIAAKLIEGKMDQQRETVVINRSTQRVFGLIQWNDLRGKLGRWKDNLSHVSRVLQNAKANGGLPRAP